MIDLFQDAAVRAPYTADYMTARESVNSNLVKEEEVDNIKIISNDYKSLPLKDPSPLRKRSITGTNTHQQNQSRLGWLGRIL